MNYLKAILKNQFINAFSLNLLAYLPVYLFFFTPYLALKVKLSYNLVMTITLILLPFAVALLFYTVHKTKFIYFLISQFIFISIFIFFLHSQGISVIIFFLLPALIFKWFSRTLAQSEQQKIFYGLLVFILIIVLFCTMVIQYTPAQKIFKQFLAYTEKAMNEFIEDSRQKEVTEKEIMKWQQIKESTLYRFKYFYPSIIFYGLAMFYVFNLFIGIIMISNYLYKKPLFINFLFIRIPENCIWLFILCWLLVLISFFLKNQIYTTIILNTAFIVTFLYIAAGSMVLIFKLINNSFSYFLRAILFFLFLQVFLSFMLYSFIALAVLGLLDYWFDFRKADLIIKNIDENNKDVSG